MLVICNGAPKAGSTWLTEIIEASKLFEPTPEKFQKVGWEKPTIDEPGYEEFFEHADYRQRDLYCKQHWRGEKKFLALLADPDIKMLNVIRDVRDVVVSRYFHDQRMSTVKWKNINEYYRSPRGQRQFGSYLSFQIFWHSNAPSPLLSKYEEMRNSPEAAIERIFYFLDREIGANEIRRIATSTSFENISNTGEGSFYRKGIVGDWQNHLDEEIIQNIRLRCDTSGYSELFPEYFVGW